MQLLIPIDFTKVLKTGNLLDNPDEIGFSGNEVLQGVEMNSL